MKRIQSGDQVVVIAGKSKGATGKVIAVHGERVIVEGVNHVVKNVKPNPQLGIEGGQVKKEASIHVSNVMVVNPETGKGGRVGFKIEDDRKVRIFKSNGAKLN